MTRWPAVLSLVLCTYQTQYGVLPGVWFSQPPRTIDADQCFYHIAREEGYVKFGYTTNLLEPFHYDMWFKEENIIEARLRLEIVQED